MEIHDWIGYRFATSTRKTREFVSFAASYRAAIRKQLASANVELVKWNTGHFYCSGFGRNRDTGRYVYFCCSDVRYWPGVWYTRITIRSARDTEDYTGGANHAARLADVGFYARRLTVDMEVPA